MSCLHFHRAEGSHHSPLFILAHLHGIMYLVPGMCVPAPFEAPRHHQLRGDARRYTRPFYIARRAYRLYHVRQHPPAVGRERAASSVGREQALGAVGSRYASIDVCGVMRTTRRREHALVHSILASRVSPVALKDIRIRMYLVRCNGRKQDYYHVIS